MADVHFWSFIIGLSVFFASISHQSMSYSNYSQVEERRLFGVSGSRLAWGAGNMRRIQAAQAFLRKDSVVNNIPKFLASLGGLGQLGSEKNLTTLEKVKQIGDVIAPILMWGLAMVGKNANMAGGVMAGMWDALSPAFGPDPMTRMINEIKDEIIALKKGINEMAVKLTEKMRKELDDKLKSIISKWFDAETNRNKYVCDKYAFISRIFSDAIRNNRPINESLRLEMIMHLNDCDDFLKDTAGVFQFREYADILWVPSLIASLMRISYLAEATNYGTYLNIEDQLLFTMWKELKFDLKQLFEFSWDAVYLRQFSLTGMFWSKTVKSRNFTALEYEGCKIQASLLYFDRELYPHGVPKFREINNDDTVIKIADYNVTEDNPRSHIQINFDATEETNATKYKAILNCITGQRVINKVPYNLSFRVTFVTNKSYYVRILYFHVKARVHANNLRRLSEYSFNGYRSVFAAAEDKNHTIYISFASEERKDRKNRFEFKTGLHRMTCDLDRPHPIYHHEIKKHNGSCVSDQIGYSGVYVIENVYAFNVLTDVEPKGEIVVKVDYLVKYEVYILGVELIVRPLYNTTS